MGTPWPHRIPNEPECKHLGGNTIGGNSNTFYPKLWEWFIQNLGIRTVFDVGCGEGHALAWFKPRGIHCSGLEGYQPNVEIALKKGVECCLHDLTKAPFSLSAPVDLIWCSEVAHSVEAKYVSNVIQTLCQGKYIALSSAVPGQNGYHMVNCQLPEYWRELLEKEGYKLDPRTAETHKVAHGHWLQSGRLYVAQ